MSPLVRCLSRRQPLFVLGVRSHFALLGGRGVGCHASGVLLANGDPFHCWTSYLGYLHHLGELHQTNFL